MTVRDEDKDKPVRDKVKIKQRTKGLVLCKLVQWKYKGGIISPIPTQQPIHYTSKQFKPN